MTKTEMDMRAQGDSILKFSRLDVLISIIVGIVAIAGAIGSWVILPYRVEKAEEAITELRSEIKIARQDNMKNQELLIRMDERIKTIQIALKIPASP